MTTRKSLLVATAAVAAAALWYLFRPDALVISKTVNEPLPAAEHSMSAMPPSAMPADAPVKLAGGRFHTNAHKTNGVATIYRLLDGRRVLRLTQFATSNGPDVRVYLVAASDVQGEAAAKQAGFVDLGALKGNIGDQNYDLPAGVDAGTTAALRSAVPSVGGTPAPELTNTSWLNTHRPLRLSELHGRVVLLNFLVFTCGNCTRTVPSLVAYDRLYRERGLTIIGIHTPEFPPYAGEHDKGNLARALTRQGIAYPNAQDNDRRTWDAYGIRYWPSFILIDKRGMIRYTGYGEFHLDDGDFRTWDQRIQQLLAE